jgi:hypothetical protein
MDPTTYGLGVILSSPLIWIGLLLIGVGLLALVWMYRGRLGYYEPEIPAVIQPPTDATLIHPAEPIAPNYHRSGECPVVARIPGATPEAGPVCPVCGAPFHAVCPSVPKERTEETEAAVDLAPQFAALDRFFNAVDEAAEVTDAALVRIVDKLADRAPADDCPLTTQEIPPLVESTPFYDEAIRNTDTRELSEVMKKVKQA